MIEILTGNILDVKEKFIGHSCNCLTKHSRGLAKSIFDKFPYANNYINRTESDVPGTIKILGNGLDQRYIINMFVQYYPGKSKYPESSLDGLAIREKYFHQCLMKIAKIPNLESIAFPDRVCCGLGGGNWKHYLGTLNNFAEYVKKVQGVKVIIYQLETV